MGHHVGVMRQRWLVGPDHTRNGDVHQDIQGKLTVLVGHGFRHVSHHKSEELGIAMSIDQAIKTLCESLNNYNKRFVFLSLSNSTNLLDALFR